MPGSTSNVPSSASISQLIARAKLDQPTIMLRRLRSNDQSTNKSSKASSPSTKAPATNGIATAPKTRSTNKRSHEPSTPKSSATSTDSNQAPPTRSSKRLKSLPANPPPPQLQSEAPSTNKQKTVSNVSPNKVVVFEKGEFLAVRTEEEDGFFICRTLQNVYKNSARISIQWLANEGNDKNVYTVEYADYTEFDCILTNVEMQKVEKWKFRLPKAERTRIVNILKRAIDAEKGIMPSANYEEIAAEGIDVSLVGTAEEEQLEKLIADNVSTKKTGKKSVVAYFQKLLSSNEDFKSVTQEMVYIFKLQ